MLFGRCCGAAFFERAATALEALPGVRTVTLATTLPVAGRGNGAWFNIIERPLPLPNSILDSVIGVQKSGAGMPAGAHAEPSTKG